jgi:uncharacterized protein (TIGR02453 family)
MIKPETLKFVKDVSQNNDRAWFAEHKSEYEEAKDDVTAFIALLIPILADADPAFPRETQPKNCLMRIYRDVRFSKNKAPYKTNMGIFFTPHGKSGNEPGYYINLEPGNCFFAAGYWQPDASDLKKIREEIDYNAQDFLDIIADKGFNKDFQLSREDSLKTAPKGYPADHPMIDVLKLKSFTTTMRIADDAFFKPTIVKQFKTAFETVYPFIKFLRTAVDQ